MRRIPVLTALTALVVAGSMVPLTPAQAAPTASISGLVTGPGGTALAGVTVRIGDVYTSGPPRPACGVGGQTVTAGDGTWTIGQLAPFHDCPVSFIPPAGSGLAAEEFNDKASPANATLLSAGAGASLTGVSAQLATGGTISGRVVAPGGTPLTGVQVELTFADGSPGPDVFATTGSTGTFSLTPLKAETYAIRLFASDNEHSYQGPPIRPAVIDGALTPLGDIVMTPVVRPTITAVSPTQLPRTIHSKVTVTGTGFQPGAKLRLYMLDMDNVTVSDVVVVNDHTVTADVVPSAPATLGPWTVEVANPDTGFGTCTGCASVVAAPTTSQALSWTAMPTALVEGEATTVRAVATSGLPVTIIASGACSGSGTAGTATVTATTVGNCVVSADQFGDPTYLPAGLVNSLVVGSSFVAVAPVRLLDTRGGVKPGAGETVEVGVPSGAGAVVLNVTGTEASGDGFVTVWPCGEERPVASSLNLVAGGTSPNAVVSKVGVGGKVCLFTQSGAHLLADLTGYFPVGSSFVAVAPVRLLDTRGGVKPGAGETVEVGVPSGAGAVVLNVTGTEASGDGFVTVWPCGEERPVASSLNLVAGGTSPNAVVSKVGAGGTAGGNDGGKVCLFTQSGTHLLVDLTGYFPVGSSFVAVEPVRLLDTRGGVKPGAGETVEVGVPSGAGAVVLNVTGTEASGDGFVTVWPCGEERPVASSLNLVAGGTSPNAVVSKVGAGGTAGGNDGGTAVGNDGGKVCLFTQSGTHLLVDLTGYFPA